MIYYLLPSLAFLGTITTYRRKWDCDRYFYWIVIVMLTLAIGTLRGENIGKDYLTYYYIFKDGTTTEIGVKWIMSLFNNFGYHCFLAAMFLIAFTTKCYAFRRVSFDPYISLLLYFSFWFLAYDINAIRQGGALGFCSLAIMSLLEKKNWKWYVLWVSLGVCCHYSMVLFFPFIFICKSRYNLRVMLVLIIIILLLAIYNIPLKLLSHFVGNTNYLIARICGYVLDDSYNSNIVCSFTTVHRFFIYMVIVSTIPKMHISENYKKICVWGAFLSLSTYLLFSNIEIIATRGSLYYRFIELFALAAVPYFFKKKIYRVLTKLLFYVYVAWQIYVTLSIPDGKLIPFHFI